MKTDKRDHLIIAALGAYLVIMMLLPILGHAADFIAILVGIVAMILWELREDRTFSVSDMWFGTLGIPIGILFAYLMLTIIYWIMI